MAKVYQMLWDCQFCGTQKLLAKTQRACPKCKAPQDPAWRYFPSEANKVEVKNYEFKGKDNVCAACNSLNVAAAKFCQSCGTPLNTPTSLATGLASGRGDGAFNQQDFQNHQVLQEQIHVTEEALEVGHWPEETSEKQPDQPQPLSLGSSKKSRSLFAHSSPIEKLALSVMGCMGCLIYGPILLGTVLASVAGLLSLRQQPTTLRVSGHRWQRTINIETYQTVSRSGWEDSLPNDAEFLSCRNLNRQTDDGTVRASYCDYKVNYWQSDDQAVASGDSLAEEPYWPTPTVKTCEEVQLGCQREGARSETYTLRLIDPVEDKQHSCNVIYPVWQTSPQGTEVEVKFGNVLRDSHCKQMKHL